ncbi:TPA: restriction endonuclease subunit S [Vibrio vulnificus]|uniref:restriction endonuclease subunit S n=1 Tax=Vibrio vulnificus TaxID=672 RepID=UPI0028CE6371|nr:restriction endonuclease subunit S [Vibrio vulnificus]HDY8167346.1 restriction endonuclease subunit S [Vibrio vulnificus]HDY8169416.1 restriction endonuclease subunit S [Vibrio vulnificus]
MDNWRDSKIEELCTLHYGKSPRGIDSDDGIYPIYGTGGIVGSTNDYLYDKPSIILGRKGSIGNIHYVDKPFWTIDTTFYVEAKNCDTKWLYYVFSSLNIEKLNEATGVPSLSRNNIYAQMLKAPSDQKEQQKIAEILSTVDKKIDLIDQKIAETEKLKTGLMQKLFSKGVGVQDENGEWQPHAEFQDSIYGNIPKTWKLFKLNQVTDYVDYRGKTPPKVESGTFLVTAKNIKNGFIDYECSKEYIPSELYDDVMSRGKPKLGDVVFTTEAPLGNVALIDRSDVAIAQRVIKFRPKDDICLDSGYLKHFMLSTYFQKELLQNATGSTVLGVKGKRLHVMLVCLPSINEQKVIVDILNEVDRKKHFLELQKAETQQLKKGLMQKLLTGEWRVPFEETEAV